MATILLVDDAAFMRNRCAKVLRDAGYQVVEAENGQDAVEKYQTLRPEGVLMDVNMPQMDGITALREIRRTDPEANVTMLTAMGQHHFIVEALTSGAFDYILKPFQPDRVLDATRKMEERARQAGIKRIPVTQRRSGPRKALVVDGDPRLCGLVSQLLRRDGLQATACTDPDRVKQLLQEEPFDAVIMDSGFSGLSGWELVALASELHPRPTVVFLTGWGLVPQATSPAAKAAGPAQSPPPDPTTLHSILSQLT